MYRQQQARAHLMKQEYICIFVGERKLRDPVNASTFGGKDTIPCLNQIECILEPSRVHSQRQGSDTGSPDRSALPIPSLRPSRHSIARISSGH